MLSALAWFVQCLFVFAVQIWPQVKAANPHLSSVTEIGAVVGAMWRDLDPVEKQRYNDQFNKEKVKLRNFTRQCCSFITRVAAVEYTSVSLPISY